MKKRVICTLCILLAMAVVGCNPVGMDETRLYITGAIFTDGSFNTPLEGVGVITTGTQETYNVLTGADGVFWIEVQLYSEGSEGSSSDGGKSTSDFTPGSATFSIAAYYADKVYYYGSEEYLFTVFAGDTLTLWDIGYTDFEENSGG